MKKTSLIVALIAVLAVSVAGCTLSGIDASVRKYAPIVGKDLVLIGDIIVQAECSPGLAPASGAVANVLNIVAPNSPAATKVEKVLATNTAVTGQLCPLVASIKTTVGAVPAGAPSQTIPATGA